VARVGHSETTPDLRNIGVEAEDSIAKRIHDGRQPSLEAFRLIDVATPTNEPDAAFSRRPITPRFAFAPFRASLTTFVSIRYIRRAFARIDAFEVGVAADGGHRRQNLGQSATARAGKRLGKNRAVFGLSAAASRPGALFQRPDEFFVHSAHQKIGHLFG
jgi:hypothetical protein